MTVLEQFEFPAANQFPVSNKLDKQYLTFKFVNNFDEVINSPILIVNAIKPN